MPIGIQRWRQPQDSSPIAILRSAVRSWCRSTMTRPLRSGAQAETYKGLRGETWTILASSARFGAPHSRACPPPAMISVEQAAHAYAPSRLARVSVCADVRGCLAILQDNYRLGLITNGSDATHLPKIAGLDSYFESVTTTDCGVGKPLPAIFDHALATLDAEPASNA